MVKRGNFSQRIEWKEGSSSDLNPDVKICLLRSGKAGASKADFAMLSEVGTTTGGRAVGKADGATTRRR